MEKSAKNVSIALVSIMFLAVPFTSHIFIFLERLIESRRAGKGQSAIPSAILVWGGVERHDQQRAAPLDELQMCSQSRLNANLQTVIRSAFLLWLVIVPLGERVPLLAVPFSAHPV